MKYIYYTFFITLFIIMILFILDSFDYCIRKSTFSTPESALSDDFFKRQLVRRAKSNDKTPSLSMEELEEYLQKNPEAISKSRDYFNSLGRYHGYIRYFYTPEVVERNVKDKNLSKIIVGIEYEMHCGICDYLGPSMFNYIYKDSNLDMRLNPYRR